MEVPARRRRQLVRHLPRRRLPHRHLLHLPLPRRRAEPRPHGLLLKLPRRASRHLLLPVLEAVEQGLELGRPHQGYRC